MAVDFHKRLKEDRIKLFVDNVTKMANNTPADGYMIGEAIGALPDNLKQFLLTEIPDKIVRAEYARRGLGNMEDACLTQGEDELKETYQAEIYKGNECRAVADLLGTGGVSPDLLETVEALIKTFPGRWTLDDLLEKLQDKHWGI